jgi:polysaccharidase protein
MPTPTKNVKPTAVNDRLSVDAEGRANGNLLANDFDANGQQLFLRTVGNMRTKDGDIVLNGKYGVLHVDSFGNFAYQAEEHKIGSASGSLSESFQYKISDGSMQDAGGLSILLDTHMMFGD